MGPFNAKWGPIEFGPPNIVDEVGPVGRARGLQECPGPGAAPVRPTLGHVRLPSVYPAGFRAEVL